MRICSFEFLVSAPFFGESLAVAGLLTEPPWLGQETGHSHPGLWLSLERIQFLAKCRLYHTTGSGILEAGGL